MKLSGWLTSIYASLIGIGGLIGYLKAGSLLSIVFASVFALLLFSSAISMFRGQIVGRYTALLYSFLLDAFFTYRLVKTKTFMPSGLMCLLSALMIAFFILQIRKKPIKVLDES